MTADRRGAKRALAVAIAATGASLVLLLRPLSVWLLPLSADGQLLGETARFLDALWILPLAIGLVAAAAAAIPALRAALAAAWSGEPGSTGGRSWVLPLAGATLLARLIAAAWSDIGLGDDGARVAWLERWLVAPEVVPTELWAPGHLYLHALSWLVLRDAVWAGIALGSLASAATVWLLGGAVRRTDGAEAGNLAALLAAILPVSSAHGATPDVNPVFACLCLGALGCAARAAPGRVAWLAPGWICVFFAAWSRFETLFLAPAFALPLWPRRRLAAVFAGLCTLPTLLWLAALQREHGAFLHVFQTLRVDPTLMRPLVSRLFDLAWAAWLAVPLPIAIVGILGAAISLRRRRGRPLVALLVLHMSSLLAATWSTGTGNQPRYLILDGSLLAAASAVYLAGMLRASRRWGGVAVAATITIIPVAPALFAPPGELWIRRSARLRAVVDCAAAVRQAERLQDAPMVWIADEAGYLFLCRRRPPQHLYHALSRAESDAGAIASALQGSAAAFVCVRGDAESERRWVAFQAAASAQFEATPLPVVCESYKLWRLTARASAAAGATPALAAAAPAWFPPPPGAAPRRLEAARTDRGT